MAYNDVYLNTSFVNTQNGKIPFISEMNGSESWSAWQHYQVASAAEKKLLSRLFKGM